MRVVSCMLKILSLVLALLSPANTILCVRRYSSFLFISVFFVCFSFLNDIFLIYKTFDADLLTMLQSPL